MIDLINKLNETYGDRWFKDQPPGARPVSYIENFLPTYGGGAALLQNVSYHCEIEVGDSDIFVVERYSTTIWSALASPFVADLYPYQLPEDYKQGAISWMPVADRKQIGTVTSILGGITYNFGVPLFVPQRHSGYSLFKEYTDPRLLILPGQTFAIAQTGFDVDAGFWRGPNEWLIGEVSGYFLTIPNSLKRSDPLPHIIKEPSTIPAFNTPEIRRKK